MTERKKDMSAQRWTTNDELRWIQEWTRQGVPARDKLERLTKYLESLDIRNIWNDGQGTSLEKDKIVSYVKRRIRSATKEI